MPAGKSACTPPACPPAPGTPEAFAGLVRAIDLVFINDVALRDIFTLRTSVATMIDNLEAWLHALGPRADVVLTMGDLGAVVFPRDDGPPIFVPALAVDVVDATGAGDTFAGVFLSLWMHGAFTGRSGSARRHRRQPDDHRRGCAGPHLHARRHQRPNCNGWSPKKRRHERGHDQCFSK